MSQAMAEKKIEDVITQCVPEQFRCFFTRTNGITVDNKEWWSWDLELDLEDSVGTHVWNLLPETCELLAWMPNASDEFVEAIWKAVADQCLTWVYGE